MPENIKQNTFSTVEMRKIIDAAKVKIKNHPTTIEVFKEYGVDLDEIDLIPVTFKELEVSARSDHGIIYLNKNLLNDPEQIDHYLEHEITHILQQTTGDKPTQGADDGNYLDNEYEIEGFQNQTEYIADTRGEEAAEAYINQVLDHHGIKDIQERKERMKELFEGAE